MSQILTGREEFLNYLQLLREAGETKRSITWSFQDKYDSAGRRVCVWCSSILPQNKKRQRWCSEKVRNCVQQFREMKGDMSYIRAQLKKRDKGVCRECRLDCELQKKVLMQDLSTLTPKASYTVSEVEDLRARWFPWLTKKAQPIWDSLLQPGWTTVGVKRALLYLRDWLARRSFWDADHITEVREGGFGCDLNNLQTLCRRCHNAKTHSFGKVE